MGTSWEKLWCWWCCWKWLWWEEAKSTWEDLFPSSAWLLRSCLWWLRFQLGTIHWLMMFSSNFLFCCFFFSSVYFFFLLSINKSLKKKEVFFCECNESWKLIWFGSSQCMYVCLYHFDIDHFFGFVDKELTLINSTYMWLSKEENITTSFFNNFDSLSCEGTLMRGSRNN